MAIGLLNYQGRVIWLF